MVSMHFQLIKLVVAVANETCLVLYLRNCLNVITSLFGVYIRDA
jgi:hypothetical protein